ncbi:GNAT family N-acetyltransferase [uncultured Hymenobacter sp.]|uniref:GNAT family N-acetyltransferase n=1 Tax=uncultured Hymenobacter sp. TaxID=170016 RepID=UPI0035CB39F2
MSAIIPTPLIRPIRPADNAALAAIIRATLAEFGAAKPGTVYYDPTTDHLHELFQAPRSQYFVAEAADGAVLGGVGIFPTPGLGPGVAELVKVYLRHAARGTGLGRRLIEQSLTWAREAGFQQIYLETLPELTQAVPLYERLGFAYLPGPLGQSGHFGCTIWMLRAA